jgi:DNA topoisomerase-1
MTAVAEKGEDRREERRSARAGKGRRGDAFDLALWEEVDPVTAARQAGLRHVSDDRPGIRRLRQGEGFVYVGPDGAPVADERALARIKALVIPPAWEEVWISPDARGHLQATGRDARGRKQYRYHPRWRELRDETKYHRMIAFGHALPKIRARVQSDMAKRGLPREKVLAAVVRLLETTLIRVGNEEYARVNKSFGLTTLRDRHAAFEGTTLSFVFRAKHGIKRRVRLRDRQLARIVKACRDIPGQELFQYVDEDGSHHPIDSGDVNAYLQEITGEHFTAKDFRTWAGTVLAAMALQEFETFDSQAAAKRNLTRAIEHVASHLGNTPAICRKCYVHPHVQQGYLDGELVAQIKEQVEADLREAVDGLRSEEAVVLAFLQRRLARAMEEAPLH